MPFEVGLFCGQEESFGGQAAESLPVAFDHQLRGDLFGGRVDECAGVTGREEVDPRVVGEEQFGGVESGGGGEGAPGGPAGVVGHVWCVVGVAGDRVVPARGSAHRAEHEHPFEFCEWNGFVSGAVCEGAVGDFVPQGEAS